MRLMVGVLGAILLACGGLLAYRAASSLTTVLEPEPNSATAAVPPGSASAVPAAEVDAPALEDVPAPASAHSTIGESFAFDQPIPPPAAPALEATPPPVASTTAAPVPSAPSKPPPTEAELRAALSATPIVMYATSWCGVCRKARQFLSGNGLRYQEIDADATPGTWDKLEKLAGRRAVPVIVVDGVVSQGLNPDGVLEAVAKSMERRLGVKGIQFRVAGKG